MEITVSIGVISGLVFLLAPGILHKAGFSGRWLLLCIIPFVNLVIPFIVAYMEWPTQSELAWRRLVDGDLQEGDYELALHFANRLEKNGRLREAIATYQALAIEAKDPLEAEYAAGQAALLSKKLDDDLMD